MNLLESLRVENTLCIKNDMNLTLVPTKVSPVGMLFISQVALERGEQTSRLHNNGEYCVGLACYRALFAHIRGECEMTRRRHCN